MIELILFGLEILFLAIVVILLARMRTKYGLVPLYMFLAASLLYGEITTSFSLFTFLGFSVAQAAITIYPLMLFSLILVYDIGGINEARRYIFGIIIAIMLLVMVNCFYLLNSKFILSPISPYDFEWQKAVLYPNIAINTFSILGFIVSVFVLIVIYKFVTGVCKYKFLCVFISLSLALYADSLIFVGGLYLSKLATSNILPAHIISKTFASFLFSLIYVTGYPLAVIKGDAVRSREMIELEETAAEFGGSVGGSLKILVVEDSEESMSLMKQLIKYEKNWEAVEAKNGKEALGMVFAENPDIIILDIMMPEMDGYQVVEILRSHRSTKNIPIIMVTAKVEKEDKLKGMAMGIDDYITKPFLPEEVIARIRMVMRREIDKT